MADTGAPFWAAPALLAALLAASGYLGKLVTDSALEWRATALKRSARLVELYAMLRAGDAAFASQKDLRGRLGRRLSERLSKLGEQLPIQQDLRGYDALFSANFGRMEPEELKLHGLIRAYTVHTFKPLNDNLLDWLRSDAHFRGLPPNDPKYGALAAYLPKLEAHLLLWRAKYEAWIPNNPSHCLVYLADEESHGVGFPKGGTKLLARLLGHDVPPDKMPTAADAEKETAHEQIRPGTSPVITTKPEEAAAPMTASAEEALRPRRSLADGLPRTAGEPEEGATWRSSSLQR